MGKLTLEAYEKRFMELLRYAPYLKDEKEMIQCFISGLPQSYQDRIEFEKPKTLEDTIHKDKCFYDESKHKHESPKDWKRKDKSGFQKKGFKSFPLNNYEKYAQSVQPSRSVHQQNFSSQSRNKPLEQANERAKEPKKGPLQCWGCGEPHILRDYPHRQHDNKRVYNVQGEAIVNDLARIIPRIYAAVENRQANHQAFEVELEGIITKNPISILIDLGSNLSYVSL
jgi:hypothetical protein